MKILLFDPIAGGHHPLYVRRVAEVLADEHQVVVAAPVDTLHRCAHVAADYVTRAPSTTAKTSRRRRPQMTEDVHQFRDIAEAVQPDHAVHLFADAALRGLVARPLRIPTTILIFRPRAHYPRAYGSPLARREFIAARGHEAMVTRWRLLRNSHSVWTLDPGAASRWARWPGAPATWFPEPPVDSSYVEQAPLHDRRGAILYGRIAPRKGLDQVARALRTHDVGMPLTLAGSVAPTRRAWLDDHLRALREVGVDVNARLHDHDELDGLAALAGARCALLPYVEHYGMSRVLLESATVGTPVIATNRGLIGYLVDRFNLGITVDPNNSAELSAALASLNTDDNSQARFAQSLAAFCRLHSHHRFAHAVEHSFSIPQTVVAGSRDSS